MIGLIWAQAANKVIGNDGGIPWSLAADLVHFREITTSSTVVMGRRTWESLPAFARPLKSRRNIVVTSDIGYEAVGAETAASLTDALALAGDVDVWVIGGQRMYEAAILLADRLEVTELCGVFDGDTFAPTIPDQYTIASISDMMTGPTPELDHRFIRYERTKNLELPTVGEDS